MPTKTQINFRKQMEQLQKEMNKKEYNEVYSYIEKDHIKSYYEKKPVSKVKVTIEIGTIIGILWTGYCIYTWVHPFIPYPGQQAQQPKVVSVSSLYPSVDNIAQKHLKIVDYISRINSMNSDIQAAYTNYNTNKNNTSNKHKILSSLIDTQNHINNYIVELQQAEIPKEMQEHYVIYLQEIRLNSMDIDLMVKILQGTANKGENFDYSNNELPKLRKQKFDAMLKGFDSAGIKYEVHTDGSVQYWYNK